MAQSPQHTLAVLAPPFMGRVSNANPHALPAGACQVQKNIGVYKAGQLDVRPGNKISAFANAIAANASNIVAVYAYGRPEGQLVVYLQADGTLKAGRNPT